MNPDDQKALADAQRRLLGTMLMPSSMQEAERLTAMLPELDMAHAQAMRGWAAYRAHASALARNTLASSYPVIHALLGSDTLSNVARDLWQHQPPDRGDLTLWGAALPDWLERCEDLAGLPYLSDVARTEWALHRAATAADATADAASFVQLTRHDPAELTLALAPGVAVVCSRFPVVSVIAAHRPDGPDFATVAGRLQDGVPECALVWRQGLAPCLTACDEPAAALLGSLLRGSSLLHALEDSIVGRGGNTFDFSHWLQTALATGLVLGVQGPQNLEQRPRQSVVESMP